MAEEQVVVVRRRLDAADVLGLLTAGSVVTVDLAGLTDVDLGTVDTVARLLLAATRAGGRLRLRNVPAALAELLALAGLPVPG